MIVKHWAAFVFGAMISGGTLLAQQQSQPATYGWRASAQTVQQPRVFSRMSDHVISDPQSVRMAALPSSAAKTTGSHSVLHFRQEQDDASLLDRQPSPSDRQATPRPTTQRDSATQPSTHQLSDLTPASDSAATNKLDAQPIVGSQSVPNAPAAAGAINNQPNLAVADMGDPPPEQDPSPGWCNLGCERKLFGSTPNGFSIGGWSQFGAHSEDSLGFNNRPDELNLHQQWFYAEKRPQCNNGWGYRADILYGIDGQNLQAFGNPITGTPDGWDNDWDHGSYGWALPQAYLSYQNCCWDVKLGKFFTPFGFESLASSQNFFYSRSYARTFIEPYSATGILGERRISDQRSLILGATAGWDTGFDQNSSGLNLITGLRSQFGKNVSLASTASLGNTGYRGEGWMNSQVLQVQLSKKTQYVLQGDMLNLGTNQEFSIINYLFHEFNPCLRAGTRLEWWKSDQLFPDTRSTWSLTNGLNFRPHANLMIRPETRLDWGAAAIDPGKLIVGVDAILTF